MTNYVQDPTMPGGWRFQYEKPIQMYAPIIMDDENHQPTGALMPSIKQMADGTPVARTEEELAALMDIIDHEPISIQEKTTRFQIQMGLASQNKAAAEELEIVEDRKAQAASTAASNITNHFTPPATIPEYQQRLRSLHYRVLDNGWTLVTVPFAYIQDEQPKRAFHAQNIGGEAHPVALLEVRDNGNPIASGDLESLEKWLAHKLHARQIEAETEKAVADDLERKRNERHAVAVNSPEGRVRELERKLAALTGEPDPEDSSKKYMIPGVMGAIGQITVNDVPQDPPAVMF